MSKALADPAPVSPCIGVCLLNADGYCLGCYRTMAEIAGWRDMSAAAQWTVLQRVSDRAGERVVGPQ